MKSKSLPDVPLKVVQFKPLSAKNIPSAQARRHDADEPREISFKSAGQRAQPLRGVNLD